MDKIPKDFEESKNLFENIGHLIIYGTMGWGQNLKRRNVERPIFRNFKIANIKITKDELFDNFIFEFNF